MTSLDDDSNPPPIATSTKKKQQSINADHPLANTLINDSIIMTELSELRSIQNDSSPATGASGGEGVGVGAVKACSSTPLKGHVLHPHPRLHSACIIIPSPLSYCSRASFSELDAPFRVSTLDNNTRSNASGSKEEENRDAHSFCCACYSVKPHTAHPFASSSSSSSSSSASSLAWRILSAPIRGITSGFKHLTYFNTCLSRPDSKLISSSSSSSAATSRPSSVDFEVTIQNSPSPSLSSSSASASASASAISNPNDVRFCILNGSPLVYCDGASAQISSIPDLDSIGEKEQIQQILHRTGSPVSVEFSHLSLESLSESLLSSPTLLHISGHGLLLSDNSHALVVENASGAAELLTTRALGKLIRAIGPERMPKCVLLLACYSESAAMEFVNGGVEHVIAVKDGERVMDRSARYFTHFFYSSLLNGMSIEKSFQIACVNVEVAIDSQLPLSALLNPNTNHAPSTNTTTSSSSPSISSSSCPQPPSPTVTSRPSLSFSSRPESHDLVDERDLDHHQDPVEGFSPRRSSSRPPLSVTRESEKFILLPATAIHSRVFVQKQMNIKMKNMSAQSNNTCPNTNSNSSLVVHSKSQQKGGAQSASLNALLLDSSPHTSLPNSTTPSTSISQPAASSSFSSASCPHCSLFPSSSSIIPCSLPARPSLIVGREFEIHRTVETLIESRCVNVYGPKRFGSSSVALMAAHFCLDRRRFSDGVFYCQLAPHYDNERDLVLAVSQSLGLARHHHVTTLRNLFLLIRTWDMCLLLDDCFTPLTAAFMCQLLRHTVRARIIFTSTQPAVFPVDSGVHLWSVSVGPLPDDAAMTLVRKLAKGRISENECTQIVASSNGSPFAIRLAMRAHCLSIDINVVKEKERASISSPPSVSDMDSATTERPLNSCR